MPVLQISAQPALLRRRFPVTRQVFIGKTAKAPEVIFSQASYAQRVEKKPSLPQESQITTQESVISPSQKPPSALPVILLSGSSPTHPKPVKNDLLINKESQYLTNNHSQKTALKNYKKLPTISTVGSKIITALSWIFIMASTAVLVVLLAPDMYYRAFPSDPVPIKVTETGSPLGGQFVQTVPLNAKTAVIPPYDEKLPDGNWIIIPRIGVNTEINESELPDESLRKGVWRVPQYGQPGDVTMPMILAAHRIGWKVWWKDQTWRYNSFYLLPELQPGDLVEVIHDKRKYLYEIYAGEEGQEITDYNADLILYTCKFLNSPLRHFRYARLLDPAKSTQSTGLSENPGEKQTSPANHS